MKRSQSVAFLFSPPAKTLALQAHLASERPSPCSISAVASLELSKPLFDLPCFHHRFEMLLKEIIQVSLNRIQIERVLAKVEFSPPPEDVLVPMIRMDFAKLLETFNHKIASYQVYVRHTEAKLKEINFLKFLYHLEAKDLWLKLLSRDASYRLKKSAELSHTKRVKPSFFRRKNKLDKFFCKLTQDKDELKVGYQQLLLADQEKLQMIKDYLEKPELISRTIIQMNGHLEREKFKLNLELFGLYQALRLADDTYANQLTRLNRELLLLIGTYPSDLEFDESWLDVNRQLFDNIHRLIKTANLIQILALEAEIKQVPSIVVMKQRDEGEDFDYFVDFSDPFVKEQYFMRVENKIGYAYFHGPFTHLAALNFILSSIYDKFGCFLIFPMQCSAPLG